MASIPTAHAVSNCLKDPSRLHLFHTNNLKFLFSTPEQRVSTVDKLVHLYVKEDNQNLCTLIDSSLKDTRKVA